MPRRPFPLLLAVAILVALAACAAHEKAGDRAAAVGDWKAAERAYGEAARRSPDKKELQDKHRQAKAAAVDGATQKARACSAAKDWECAYSESSYALDLEPGRVELATFRRDAAREAALLRVAAARGTSARGDHRAALGLLESAKQASDDPRVVAEARRVSPAVVDAALFEAEALRAKARFPEALELYTSAANVDPAVQPRLEAVRAEYERWKDVEAERLAVEGDKLLGGRRFADAQARYDAAVRLRPNSRAAPLARQTALLASGEAAAERRDFAAAERAFTEASRLPGAHAVALAELDRVKVRPWAIRLRSVRVAATRPDGWPWAGPRSSALDRIAERLEQGGRGLRPGLAVELARRVPRENQPTLVVTAALPDGRGVQSAPRRGAHVTLDAVVVVASNALDDRVLSLRVVHDDGRRGQVDVGLVSFRLGDLVSARELSVSGGAVDELRLEADVSDLPDGGFSGLLPIPEETNLAEGWSLPAHASRGIRIASVDAALAAGDLLDRGPNARPQLQIEIEQRGQVVYRSPVAAGGRPAAGFSPAAAYLFVVPHEALVLRLLDHEGARVVRVNGTVRGEDLLRGSASVVTPAGSAVRLRLEPRRAGPDTAPRTAAR
jgi:tetratricopeptide (TPR) repeat protein